MKPDKRRDFASYDPAHDVHWTPAMALVWVVYRDMNKVREVSPDFTQYGRYGRKYKFKTNSRYVVNPGVAVRELWRQMELGTLAATGADANGRRAIGKDEWCDLIKIGLAELQHFVSGALYADNIRMFSGRAAFSRVAIPVNEVLRVFPANEELVGKPDVLTAKPIRRGKPSKPKAAAEALKRIYPDGRPSRNSGEMMGELREKEPAIGNLSNRSMTRAIALAWPKSAPNAAN